MTQGEAAVLILVPVALAIEVILCHRGSLGYVRSVLPLFRHDVSCPASPVPVETWVDEADEEYRALFGRLRWRRHSASEVVFWESWHFTEWSLPVFIAGRVVEGPQGRLQLLAGPRWFIPIFWLWAFAGAGPSFDVPTPVLLGMAVLGLGALQYVRVILIARALGHGSRSVRGRTTRS